MTGPPVRWGASLLAVLGLHGALVAGLALAVLGDGDPASTPPVLIDLPPAPAAPPPPAPVEKPPPPVPPPPKPVRKAEPPRPQSPPLPAAPLAQDESRVTEAVAAPVPMAAGEPAPPRPEAGSSAPPSWIGKVMARLERYKRYPSSARAAHEQGTAYLRFAIDREGRVLRSHVDHSSGVPSLDQESLDLVERADPLPAPPDEVRGDPVELVVPIAFTLRDK